MDKHAAKPTPGPWTIQFAGGAHLIHAKSDALSGYRAIAQVIHYDDEDKANARLISAAPDMYEALKVAMAEFARIVRVGKSAPVRDFPICVISEALAKAQSAIPSGEARTA